jgi:hypothetical protein
MRKIYIAAIAAVFAALVIPASAIAEDTPTIARMWKVVPKDGKWTEMQDAMKAHMEFRVANGDPWGWNVYSVVGGKIEGARFVRSANHTWADVQAYSDSEFVTKAMEHWNANVHPFVDSYVASIANYHPDISQWPEGALYKYYRVFTYRLAPGKLPEFKAAVKAITDVLIAADWDNTWAFTEHLTGDLPAVSLVIPEDGWGGFVGPDKSAREVVAAAKGEDVAKAMWDAFTQHVESIESTVYLRDEEMSTKAAGD